MFQVSRTGRVLIARGTMRGLSLSLWHEEWWGVIGTSWGRVKDNEVIFPPDPTGQDSARALIEAVHSITPSPSIRFEPTQREVVIASWPGATVSIFKDDEDTPYVLRVEKAAIALRAQEMSRLLNDLAEYFELVGVLRSPT